MLSFSDSDIRSKMTTDCEDQTTMFQAVADLKPADDASIHGIVANVSPRKKGSTPYFDATLCDEEGTVRVVGFTSAQRKRLANCQDTMDPVDLNKIKVKKAKHSDEMEILLKSSSEVRSSPKKFALSKVLSNNISLDQMDKQSDYVRVTVIAKVIRIEDLVTVTSSLRKQNVTIADNSAAAKLTLWENSIGKLLLNKSYRFSNFTVCTYRSEKYLSLPREGATFEEVPDIGDVAEDDLPDDSVVISHATVAAATLSDYRACLACKSKLEPIDGTLSRCTNCNMDQLTENTVRQTSANLLLCNGVDYVQLSAFTNILRDIVNGADISVPNLLTAPPFRCTYENKIITSVARDNN